MITMETEFKTSSLQGICKGQGSARIVKLQAAFAYIRCPMLSPKKLKLTLKFKCWPS